MVALEFASKERSPVGEQSHWGKTPEKAASNRRRRQQGRGGALLLAAGKRGSHVGAKSSPFIRMKKAKKEKFYITNPPTDPGKIIGRVGGMLPILLYVSWLFEKILVNY